MRAEPSELVRASWTYRIKTEYVSGVYAQDHARQLTYVGASPDLIQAAFDVASDELRHASIAAEVCAEAGGAAAEPIEPEFLAMPGHENVLGDLVIGTIQNFCIAETVATRVICHAQEGTTVGAARDVVDVIVHDEARHSALGWATLDWLLDSAWRDEVRAFIGRELDGWIAAMGELFCQPGRPITLDERAWGLVSNDEIAAIWRTSYAGDLAPRFARRGFEIEPA
jgi:hypothetical protein